MISVLRATGLAFLTINTMLFSALLETYYCHRVCNHSILSTIDHLVNNTCSTAVEYFKHCVIGYITSGTIIVCTLHSMFRFTTTWNYTAATVYYMTGFFFKPTTCTLSAGPIIIPFPREHIYIVVTEDIFTIIFSHIRMHRTTFTVCITHKLFKQPARCRCYNKHSPICTFIKPRSG